MTAPQTSPFASVARNRPGLAFLLRFALGFALLEAAVLWALPGLPDFVRLELTARPAAWLINALTPSLAVVREGLLLVTGRSRDLLVGQGCEALPALLLFVPALAALPRPWPARLLGVLLGSAAILLFNLIRITGLYYVLVFRPELFDLVHEYVGQVLTIAVAAGMFLLLSREDGPARPELPGWFVPLSPGRSPARLLARVLTWLACAALCMALLSQWGGAAMRAVALVPEALVQALANGQARAVERTLAALAPAFRNLRIPPGQTRVTGQAGPEGYDLTIGLARIATDAPTPLDIRHRAEVETRLTRFNAYPFQLLVLLTLPLVAVLPGLSLAGRLGSGALLLSLLGLAYGLELFLAFLAEFGLLLSPLLDGRAWVLPLARRATVVMQNGGEWFVAALILALCWRIFARRGEKAG
jgi:exosortase/archaeosortase family protein